jgi:hypothetical protein
MAAKITVKNDYILVEPEEVNFWDIWESIGQVRNLPGFCKKNNIWAFHKGPIKLDYVDLYKLKDFVEEIYAENLSKGKTAIVVETGIQSAMASLFSQIVEELPLEIKIFSDFQDAIDWITKK